MMGTNRGEVGHTNSFVSFFINDREPTQNGFITGIPQAHLLQEAAVDLIDQFEVTGQQVSEQV